MFVMCFVFRTETTYLTHHQGSSWPLKMGKIGCHHETPVNLKKKKIDLLL